MSIYAPIYNILVIKIYMRSVTMAVERAILFVFFSLRSRCVPLDILVCFCWLIQPCLFDIYLLLLISYLIDFLKIQKTKINTLEISLFLSNKNYASWNTLNQTNKRCIVLFEFDDLEEDWNLNQFYFKSCFDFFQATQWSLK